jgi:hypothetical protein
MALEIVISHCEEVSTERCTDRASYPHGPDRSVLNVDNRPEVREFLISRRAKINPQQAGLPDGSHGHAAVR